jgi:acyl-CoA synthetase (AMP-forming)/AMP-acid ligase II
METIVDLLEDAAGRFGPKQALGLRTDDGSTWHWTYAEVLRRSRIAAWRLKALGLNPGDRVLTWSPSTPALPAAYFGAMPRGSCSSARRPVGPDTVARIVDKSVPSACSSAAAARPRPRGSGSSSSHLDRRGPVLRPDDQFPPDWEAQLAAWPRPKAPTSSSSCSRRGRPAIPRA